jgi:hypothetical protein
MIVKYVPSIHLFSLMAPQQPKKVTMTTKMLTAMRMMADVEKTVIEKLFFENVWKIIYRLNMSDA